MLTNIDGSEFSNGKKVNQVFSDTWRDEGIMKSFDQSYLIMEVLKEKNIKSNDHRLGTKGFIYYPK